MCVFTCTNMPTLTQTLHTHTDAHTQILSRHKEEADLVLKANIRTSLAAILWDVI